MSKKIVARIVATLLVLALFAYPFVLIGLKGGLICWAIAALGISLGRLVVWCVDNWD